jgi:hypothetical protein
MAGLIRPRPFSTAMHSEKPARITPTKNTHFRANKEKPPPSRLPCVSTLGNLGEQSLPLAWHQPRHRHLRLWLKLAMVASPTGFEPVPEP